ncbi:DUF4835 family protein [Microbacter margulisiae]|uniref:DUF4835 domain-containing protein n=1 Tax=Microbacter margulisiae TaxID=1350067 RepID=A0A7W5DR21_9PORP|nr:DUF4835 family protein [Microbacter margulisiae]MBB3186688.1 hypothetical protein [Microbacter margulisiae]
MKKLVLLFLLSNILLRLSAQELNCHVQINASMIQGTNTRAFSTLEKALNDWMNSRQWTNLDYSPVEKIDCNFIFTVKAYSNNYFTTELQVQSRRPVFNSSYETSLFNFQDKNVNFNYVEGQSMEINENQVDNNLLAVMMFYGYIILGEDADSFALKGGTSFFQRANSIVNSMQSSTESGWKAFESDQNRYALINGILDPKLASIRTLNYEYNRLGLDMMADNPDNGRATIAQALTLLKQANNNAPSNIVISIFLNSKIDEIADIFTQGTTSERNGVYSVLMQVAPALANRFDKIQNNN